MLRKQVELRPPVSGCEWIRVTTRSRAGRADDGKVEGGRGRGGPCDGQVMLYDEWGAIEVVEVI